MIRFTLNGKKIQTEADPSMPLLWFLRDEIGLTGTKYGCGLGQCGSCMVLLENTTSQSCQIQLSLLEGKKVTTIEGLSGKAALAVQRTWQELNVVQCGYCQSGQIISATALLSRNKRPKDQDIDEAMTGNICRCATYHRIRQAIHKASKKL